MVEQLECIQQAQKQRDTAAEGTAQESPCPVASALHMVPLTNAPPAFPRPHQCCGPSIQTGAAGRHLPVTTQLGESVILHPAYRSQTSLPAFTCRWCVSVCAHRKHTSPRLSEITAEGSMTLGTHGQQWGLKIFFCTDGR